MTSTLPGTGLARLALLLSLAACTSAAQPAAQPLPTVVLDSASGAPRATARPSGGVTASGIVVPGEEVRLSFAVTDRVKAINFPQAGMSFKKGQILAELDDTQVQAQIRQAESAVAVAQSNLDLLSVGPTAEQLRQAGAAIVAARATFSRTVAGPRRAEVEAASAALSAATATLNKAKAGPTEDAVAAASAALRSAEAALRQAQGAYDRAYARNPAGIGADPAALALERATNDYTAAKAVYDGASRPADDAQLGAANEAVAAARAQLDRLVQPAQVFDTEYALAQIEIAQARMDELKSGPRPAQLAAARAQVAAAQAALDAQRAALSRYTLVAPMSGVVLRRNVQVGEIAIAGAPVMVIADLDRLRVETTDLGERAVPGVSVGQAVSVVIKALNQTVGGRVDAIAPVADTLGGDVVYKVSVTLDALPTGLRAGMSAEVQFGAGR